MIDVRKRHSLYAFADRDGRWLRPLGLLARLRTLAGRWRSALGASVWGSLLGRALLVIIGIFALGWVGRVPAAPRSVGPTPAAASSTIAATLAPSVAPGPTAAPPAATTTTPAPAPAAISRARATADDPFYVNHASAEELRRLPGVGPKRAEAIVALRQRMGRFQRLEDLLRVKGIGRTTLRRWRPLVRLDTADAGAP